MRAKASSGSLNFPSSVVEFFQGALGIPVGGFPEPLRTDVLRGAKKLDETFEGRPGAELPDVDLEAVRTTLEATHGIEIDDKQLMSAVMYPKVFEDFMAATSEFGDLSALPTRAFVEPMEVVEERWTCPSQCVHQIVAAHHAIDATRRSFRPLTV